VSPLLDSLLPAFFRGEGRVRSLGEFGPPLRGRRPGGAACPPHPLHWGPTSPGSAYAAIICKITGERSGYLGVVRGRAWTATPVRCFLSVALPPPEGPWAATDMMKVSGVLYPVDRYNFREHHFQKAEFWDFPVLNVPRNMVVRVTPWILRRSVLCVIWNLQATHLWERQRLFSWG